MAGGEEGGKVVEDDIRKLDVSRGHFGDSEYVGMRVEEN